MDGIMVYGKLKWEKVFSKCLKCPLSRKHTWKALIRYGAFTLCVRDNFRIGWKYQLPRLIYTNDYCFVVLLDVLGGASPSLYCICLFLQWIFSICFKKEKNWTKKSRTHMCYLHKKREWKERELASLPTMLLDET